MLSDFGSHLSAGSAIPAASDTEECPGTTIAQDDRTPEVAVLLR